MVSATSQRPISPKCIYARLRIIQEITLILGFPQKSKIELLYVSLCKIHSHTLTYDRYLRPLPSIMKFWNFKTQDNALSIQLSHGSHEFTKFRFPCIFTIRYFGEGLRGQWHWFYNVTFLSPRSRGDFVALIWYPVSNQRVFCRVEIMYLLAVWLLNNYHIRIFVMQMSRNFY